ncbi:MAG: 3-keto-disaccharide hydrolase [Mariniblastus sp.]
MSVRAKSSKGIAEDLILRGDPVVLRCSLFLFFGFACCLSSVFGQENTPDKELRFRDLFNGKDLTGWIDVNTSPETWSVKDGLLVCTGKPIGVMRSDRQYENFILEIEWRHMEPGGNSGVFLWCDAIPDAKNRLPKGMEVQMLELDWVNQHKRKDGSLPPIAYVQGELFGAGGMTATPENPRGNRSKSVEHRCKGVGQWNRYVVVAVDGNVKLSINGKFVNGIRDASVKKGYLCLESEGREIHFRTIKIMELPDGMANESNTAPLIK